LFKFSKTFAKIRSDFAKIRSDFAKIRSDFAKIRSDFAKIRSGFAKIRSDFAKIRSDFAKIRSDFAKIRTKRPDFSSLIANFVPTCGHVFPCFRVFRTISVGFPTEFHVFRRFSNKRIAGRLPSHARPTHHYSIRNIYYKGCKKKKKATQGVRNTG